MSKRSIYFIGLLTIVGFPILGSIVNLIWLKKEWCSFFGLTEPVLPYFLLGALIGIAYAVVLLFVYHYSSYIDMPDKVERMIQSMNLNLCDSIFLSVCAGVGEELFFRAAVQPYTGPLIGSLFFVAVHGYIVPWSWKKSIYGFVVMPLALILSYGFEWYGIWLSIGVHVFYDFVLFESIRRNKNN